jgi:hypothetical protein
LFGSSAPTEVSVCVVTTTATLSRVTPGAMLPKLLPVIVIVGGLIERFVVTAVMTGVSLARAGAAPNVNRYKLPRIARQADASLWCNRFVCALFDIFTLLFVFGTRQPLNAALC